MNREYCVHLSSNAYLSEFKDETNGPVFEIIDSQDRAIYLTIDQYADLVRYHPLYKELVERVKTNAANGDARMKAEQQVRDLEKKLKNERPEIDALRAENARLRVALDQIAKRQPAEVAGSYDMSDINVDCSSCEEMIDTARKALKGGEPGKGD